MKLRLLLGVLLVAAIAYGYRTYSDSSVERTVATPSRSYGFDAGAAEDATVAEDLHEPAALDGTSLTIELVYGIESYYGSELAEDETDREFAARVAALSSGEAQYDPWLSQAAREIAVQGAILGQSPPEPVLSFILRSAGSPEGSVAQLLVQVRGDDPDTTSGAIASALKTAPKGPGQLLIGVGEAATENSEYDRRLVVVSARRDYELAATTRQLELGETWEISGRAPEGFGEASASVLYPNHSIVVMPVELVGRDFEIRVPAGELAGTLRVSIDGIGRQGPGKLLQVQAEVGRPLPTEFEVLLPPDENFTSVAEAEAYALERLNYDRVAEGLKPLVLDPALSEVARSHSLEMRDQDFFGHKSPATGLAGDRLRHAGYGATTHGENLAFNDSIAEAQSSLMESVGHRRNLVSTSFSHVGIGLARSDAPSGRAAWHLTQLFARKVVPLDAQRAADELVARINAKRADHGLGQLVLREELVELAKAGCEKALHAELEGIPGSLAPEASRLMRSRVAVTAHAFYELETLDISDLCADAEFGQIGLALLRDPDSLEGRTFLIVVVAEPS